MKRYQFKGTLIKQCASHDVCYFRRLLPMHCLYGKFTYKEAHIPWYMEEYPQNIENLVLYVYYNNHWVHAKRKYYQKLYKDVSFYIEKNNLLGIKTIPHNGLANTFQSGYPEGKKSKATTFKACNDKYWKRGDGAGYITSNGMLLDTIRTSTGEFEYNFNGKKPPIVTRQRYYKLQKEG